MKAIIYSTEKIKGLNGTYANPSLFNGDTENCDIVYTDDAKIRDGYKEKGVEIKSLPKQVERTKVK